MGIKCSCIFRRCCCEFREFMFIFYFGPLLVCKSKNSVSWVSQSMILFIVVSSLCLQDYIFFILSFGLFLLSLYYCSCSFHCKIDNLVTIRSSEVHLYYNLQVFYWHFLESLWLFIFLVLCLAKKGCWCSGLYHWCISCQLVND